MAYRMENRYYIFLSKISLYTVNFWKRKIGVLAK